MLVPTNGLRRKYREFRWFREPQTVFPRAIAWYTEAGMGCPCLLPSLRMLQEKGLRILTLESAGCYKQELGWP